MDVVELVNVTAMLMSFVPHAIFRQFELLIQPGFLRAQALNSPPYLPALRTRRLSERPVLSWYQGPFQLYYLSIRVISGGTN